VIPRRSRYSFSRGRAFSKRTAAPAGTARLAESPPAYSVSEREADDQTDCNFQHSDTRAWAVTRTPPEGIKRLKGRGLSGPPVECLREVILWESAWETRPARQSSFRAYLDICCTARAHNRSGSRSPCFANSIITLATSTDSGSVRSVNPSLPNAASNAADIFALKEKPRRAGLGVWDNVQYGQ
jgi:hypothetical protein